jgi:putative sigma-54 modulation protein
LEIKIALRHFDPPVDFKTGVKEKLGAVIVKHFVSVQDAGIVVTLENSRYTAEADIKVKGASFHAHDQDYNLHQCMEKVIKKIETQMKKWKEKKISQKKKNNKAGGLNEHS